MPDDEEEPVIICETLPNLRQTVKASSKTLASILSFANLQHSSSKELTVTVKEVILKSLDRNTLQEAILEKNWKPRMETIAKHGVTPSMLRYVLPHSIRLLSNQWKTLASFCLQISCAICNVLLSLHSILISYERSMVLSLF